MRDDRLPDDLVQCLRAARRLAALTGAGVSAESGIPTFRDAQTGVWARHDPMQLASPEGFAADPALVWNWYADRRRMIAATGPNPAHDALAEMQHRVESFTLITQNVDGLHGRAGSTDVLELHGNIARSVCSRTGRPIDEEWLRRHADSVPPPSPHAAAGLARPDVVWFGEMLDEATLEAAFEAAAECELMIVAGTAGAVQPAASLPAIAREHGAVIIDINPEAGEITRLADWHLQGPASQWLPRLSEALAS
jgi:NAD-dependent deacetylase